MIKEVPIKLNVDEISASDKHALSEILNNARKISKKYNISEEDVFKLSQENAKAIPLSVLCSNLAPLEAAVSYLKDTSGFSINEISKLLGRDYKNIWATYNNAKKRKLNAKKCSEESKKILIPIDAFSNPNRGIFESAVLFLKGTLGMKYSRIAKITGRDQRTIWNAHHKAEGKAK
jgi:DNA-directed RNA polymerase specialized sigma24 family protein